MEAALDRLLEVLGSYLPRIGASLAILLGGLLLAAVARRATSILLRRLGFDALADRVGLGALLRRRQGPDSGRIRTPSQLAGAAVSWVIVVLALLAALAPLGIQTLNATLNQIFLYAPRLLAAVLILIVGTSAAALLAELTQEALADVGVTRLNWVSGFVKFGIIFVAAMLAAAMLGVDVTLLVALTVIVLGAVALTVSLAVGLGLRGVSENIAASRYVAEGISEGDRVSVNGFSGTVERIGHAVTTVRSADGRAYLVPNAYFLEHVVEVGATPDLPRGSRRPG
jgi:small-conductance mechanosensitive channel